MQRTQSLSVITALLLIFFASVVCASENRFNVELQPGSLRQALDRLATLAHLQILYDDELVRGRSTPGIKGSLTASEALERLLAPTDIGFRFTASDAVALYRQAHIRSDQTARATQPDTVTISTDRFKDGSYEQNATETAMKVDGPPLMAPVASQSLSQQLLRDQQVVRIEDALEYVSGIEVAPSGQSALGFDIRGVPTYQYYVDGVRVSPDLHHDGFRDLANVEQIDIVKGGASTLYGRTEPGGLINIVTKPALSEPYISVQEQTGAFSYHRTQLDAGGPLSRDRGLLYRFNAAYESGSSFRDSLDHRRIFVAPVVTWKSSPRTETTAYLEYLDSHDPVDSGLPVIGTRLPPVPIGETLEDGGETHTTELRGGIRGSHSFENGWTVRHHLDARLLHTPQSPQVALAVDGLDPSTCRAAACPVDRELLSIPDSHGQIYYVSVDLTRNVGFWGTHHSLLSGVEFFQVHGFSLLLTKTDPTLGSDLFAPRHGPVPVPLLQIPDWRFLTATTERWTGLYFQDQVSLPGHLSLLAGVRQDYIMEQTYFAPSTTTGAHQYPVEFGNGTPHVQAVEPRAGLLWHPEPDFSWYASYARNVGVQTGLFPAGGSGTNALVGMEKAEEWEVGMKRELLDGHAEASVAWFDLVKNSIALPVMNPVLNTRGFRKYDGSVHSRGLELDFHGEISQNLQVIASYAYIDSRIFGNSGVAVDINGNFAQLPSDDGHRLFGVPRNGGSAWVAYHPGGGRLRGLKLGLGAIIRSVRQGDNANDYQLPGFTRWNALAGYGWRAGDARFAVQLNVDNLFNTRYFESLNGTHTVMPGTPRRWVASVRAEF